MVDKERVLSHQTIGLLGDWGVGKSTLVHLLKNELVRRQDQQPFLFAEFNAWAYEHTDNLQADACPQVLGQIVQGGGVPDVRRPNYVNLGGNVTYTMPPTLTGQPFLPATLTREVGGIKVGFIGITSDMVPLMYSSGTLLSPPGLSFVIRVDQNGSSFRLMI